MKLTLVISLVMFSMIIFSVLSYYSKRRDNKKNLQHAIVNNKTIRLLTDGEFELLEPYLNNKILVKPYKFQSSLVSRNVSVVTGRFVCNGLANGIKSTYYYLIGDIEVFLPYHLLTFITTNNVAEVVFTKRYAFVVNLNGYSLIDAKNDIDIKSELDERWSNGDQPDFNAQENADNKLKKAKVSHCEILEQRNETTLETMRKNNTNRSIWFDIASAVSLFLLLCYSGGDDLVFLVFGGVFFIVAITLYLYKSQPKIQKVNQIKGTIKYNKESSHALLMGYNMLIVYPKHWKSILPDLIKTDVDMSVTVGSRELIRYGHSLSIEKEIEQNGAPKFWGKNCLLSIAGIILFGYTFLSIPSLVDDFAFTHNWIKNKSSLLQMNNLSELRGAVIEEGDWIELKLGGALCDVSSSRGKCKKIILNEAVFDLEGVITPLPEWVKKLSDNSLLVTERDNYIYSSGNNHHINGISFDNNYYSSNRKKTAYTKLLNMNELIMAVNTACTIQYFSCKRLKNILIASMINLDDKLNDWDAVVNYAQQKPSEIFIFPISIVNDIENSFKSVSGDFFRARELALLDQLKNSPQADKSIELNLINEYFVKISLDYALNDPKITDEKHILPITKQYVSVEGSVSNINYRDDGTVKSLDINHNNRYRLVSASAVPSAVLMLFAFCIITVFTTFQGLTWIYKMYFNKRRMNKILNGYKYGIL